jgi:hypothetical protein
MDGWGSAHHPRHGKRCNSPHNARHSPGAHACGLRLLGIDAIPGQL